MMMLRCFLVALLAACATPSAPALKAGALPQDMLKRAVETRFVFLGELHDNPQHHVLQLEVLEALIASGRRPALVFEMLDVDQTPIVLQQHDPATFGEAVKWQERGWPDYAMYEPLIRFAMVNRLPIVAGNLGREELMASAKKGVTPAAFGFVQTLPAAAHTVIEDNIRKGHCGYADEASVAAIASAQELRDAHLAQRMMASSTRDGAVLIAGGEHASREHGAAYWVATSPGMSAHQTFSIGFVENDGDKAAFHVTFVTSAPERPDPCVAFKEKLERLQ